MGIFMKKWKIGVIADCLRLPFAESMTACAKLGADGVQMYAVEGDCRFIAVVIKEGAKA